MIRPEATDILREIKEWYDDSEHGPVVWFSPYPLRNAVYLFQDGPTRRLIIGPEYRDLITQAIESGELRARLPKKVENARLIYPDQPQDLQGFDGPESGTGERRTAPHRQPLLSRWAARLRRRGGSPD